MTRIDFHTHVDDKLHFACRLIRTVRARNNNIVVFCADEDQLQALDAALWNLGETSFLPHVRASDPLAAHTPVLLTSSEEDGLPHHQILINLAPTSPAYFARFERLLEIVSTDEKDAAAGRERYGYYRQRGYPLEHHNRSKNEQPGA